MAGVEDVYGEDGRGRGREDRVEWERMGGGRKNKMRKKSRRYSHCRERIFSVLFLVFSLNP